MKKRMIEARIDFNWQVGLLISTGKNYMNERYIVIELPFFYINITLK